MKEFDNLTFKKLDFSGLQTLVSWAAKEGWNPGLHDSKAFWATDPNGFYGYYYKNQLIGGGSIVSYDKNFGFMGFFIVLPEFRSKGIGRKLWYKRRDKLMSRLKPGSTIGMDGVIDMQKFYAKGGFKISFRDERYEVTGSSFNIDSNISLINNKDLHQIADYDQQYFGTSRINFLKSWLILPQSNAFKHMSNNYVTGYAVIRKANTGFKIGPLFAESYEIAENLFKACLNYASYEKVYIDIPVINKSAVELIKRFNAHYVFECARMYHGSPPEINTNNVYGITTFELG